MDTILTAVTMFMNNALNWMTDMVGLVESQPILMLFVVCVPLVGLGIGLVRRLLNAN